MTIGYNPASEYVKLFGTLETHKYAKINCKSKQIASLVTRMEDLEAFLGLVASRTDDSNRLNFENAKDQAMIDKLRTEGNLEHIFRHGTYSWKDKEIENLTRLLNQHIEGPLQREISRLSEDMMLDQHELAKAVELFNSGLKRMTNLIERI